MQNNETMQISNLINFLVDKAHTLENNNSMNGIELQLYSTSDMSKQDIGLLELNSAAQDGTSSLKPKHISEEDVELLQENLGELLDITTQGDLHDKVMDLISILDDMHREKGESKFTTDNVILGIELIAGTFKATSEPSKEEKEANLDAAEELLGGLFYDYTRPFAKPSAALYNSIRQLGFARLVGIAENIVDEGKVNKAWFYDILEAWDIAMEHLLTQVTTTTITLPYTDKSGQDVLQVLLKKICEVYDTASSSQKYKFIPFSLLEDLKEKLERLEGKKGEYDYSPLIIDIKNITTDVLGKCSPRLKRKEEINLPGVIQLSQNGTEYQNTIYQTYDVNSLYQAGGINNSLYQIGLVNNPYQIDGANNLLIQVAREGYREIKKELKGELKRLRDETRQNLTLSCRFFIAAAAVQVCLAGYKKYSTVLIERAAQKNINFKPFYIKHRQAISNLAMAASAIFAYVSIRQALKVINVANESMKGICGIPQNTAHQTAEENKPLSQNNSLAQAEDGASKKVYEQDRKLEDAIKKHWNLTCSFLIAAVAVQICLSSYKEYSATLIQSAAQKNINFKPLYARYPKAINWASMAASAILIYASTKQGIKMGSKMAGLAKHRLYDQLEINCSF